MKKMYLVLLLLPLSVFSQELDSILNTYGEHFPQEKIHFHFDKSVYGKGETIWFKAYLMTGTRPSDWSKNLYADWYDDNGTLIDHQVYPVFGASAKGRIDIPGNYSSGSFHLRAYTRWMLNFDSAFLFEKDIPVSQPQKKTASAIPRATTLHLFPEGGDLVAGITSRVAFLADDANGNPVFVRGAIRNGKGELLDSFAVEHDGMGSFELAQPGAAESYSISWQDENGVSGSSRLPQVQPSGATVQAAFSGNTIRVRVERSRDKAGNFFLLAHMNQQVLYKARLNLQGRAIAVTDIDASRFPTGVVQLSLFDASWRPVAERIVFADSHPFRFDVSVTATGKPEKRSKQVIEIAVPDSIVSNMSVSVTDESLPRGDGDIVSQFLLCDEIKGKIHQPAAYFSDTGDSTRHFLDLVMLTHGWRRFNWQDMAQANLPGILYPRDTEYIRISGLASGHAFDNLDNKEFITLIVSTKESNQQIIPVPMEQNGTFGSGGFVFYDTAKLFYNFGRKKISDKIRVDFHTNLASARLGFLPRSGGTDASLLPTAGDLLFDTERARLGGVTTLQAVTVHSTLTPKNTLDSVNDRYASGAFSGESRYRGDVMNDPQALMYRDVLMYLQSRVPGLQVQPKFADHAPLTVPGIKPSSDLYEVSLRGESEAPWIFLNESLSEIDVVAHIPMSDIAYVKVFSAGFYGTVGNGRGGVIAVYTRKAGEGLEKKYGPDAKAILMGYTKYKEFYSPDYSDSSKGAAADLRTTLYWNPYILTGPHNQKVQLSFFNNDLSRKLRVVLEGINAEGKLARVEKIIE